MVVCQQPAGGLHQSSLCEFLQPRAVPRRQLTPPGALGWLLHPLEPSYETSGMSGILWLIYELHSTHSLTFFVLDLVLTGTGSPAVQGAAGQACGVAEESGRTAARGDQSFCFLLV